MEVEIQPLTENIPPSLAALILSRSLNLTRRGKKVISAGVNVIWINHTNRIIRLKKGPLCCVSVRASHFYLVAVIYVIGLLYTSHTYIPSQRQMFVYLL